MVEKPGVPSTPMRRSWSGLNMRIFLIAVGLMLANALKLLKYGA